MDLERRRRPARWAARAITSYLRTHKKGPHIFANRISGDAEIRLVPLMSGAQTAVGM